MATRLAGKQLHNHTSLLAHLKGITLTICRLRNILNYRFETFDLSPFQRSQQFLVYLNRSRDVYWKIAPPLPEPRGWEVEILLAINRKMATRTKGKI
jgi:hypothetical protein